MELRSESESSFYAVNNDDLKLSPVRSISPDSGLSSPCSFLGSPESQLGGSCKFYTPLTNYGMFYTNGDLLRMYEKAACSIGLQNSVIQSNIQQALMFSGDSYLNGREPHQNYIRPDIPVQSTEQCSEVIKEPRTEIESEKLNLKIEKEGKESEKKVTESNKEQSEPNTEPESQPRRRSSIGELYSLNNLPEPAHLPLRFANSEAPLPLLRPIDLSIITSPPNSSKDIKSSASPDSLSCEYQSKPDESCSDSGRESVSPPPLMLEELQNENKTSQRSKPPYSYIALISMAILSTTEKKMILGDIYKYISDHFPYYDNSDRSWRNSVRHNLSVNECFIKIGRASSSKGFYWAIHPACFEDFAKGDFRRRQARRRARGNLYAYHTNNAHIKHEALEAHNSGQGYVSMSSAPYHGYQASHKYHPYSRPVKSYPTKPYVHYSYAPGFSPPQATPPPVPWYPQAQHIGSQHLLPGQVPTLSDPHVMPSYTLPADVQSRYYYPSLASLSQVAFGSNLTS